MAPAKESIQAIKSAIQQENLPWTAGSTELTALSEAEQKAHLGLVVSAAEQQQLAAEFQMQAAKEQAEAVTFGAPAAVDWRTTAELRHGGQEPGQLRIVRLVLLVRDDRVGRAHQVRQAVLQHRPVRGLPAVLRRRQLRGLGADLRPRLRPEHRTSDEACMPYQATNMNCATSRCSDWENRLTKISSYTGHATMQARKDAIANSGPLLAGMAVFNDFFAYNSGVYVKTAGSALAGYHCITVVGYDDNQQSWILKNSWGTELGQWRLRPDPVRPGRSADRLQLDDVLGRAAGQRRLAVRHDRGPDLRQPRRPERLGLLRRLRVAEDPAGHRGRHHQHAGALRVRAGANEPVTVYADGDNVYQAYLL